MGYSSHHQFKQLLVVLEIAIYLWVRYQEPYSKPVGWLAMASISSFLAIMPGDKNQRIW